MSDENTSTLSVVFLRMGRTIRDLDPEGDHIELWANDPGPEAGQPEYIPEIVHNGGLPAMVAEVLVQEVVGLAEPGEFFLNREYARGQIELIDRVMEVLGDPRTSEERRPAIIAQLAERTQSEV